MAKKYVCKHENCGVERKTLPQIYYHLHNIHNIKDIKKGEDYEITDGKGTTVKARKRTKPIDVMCLICQHPTSRAAISWHMRYKHDKGATIGKTYRMLTDEEKSQYPQPKRAYGKKTKAANPITPQAGFVRVPVMLEIPIVLGSARIIEVLKNE